MFKIIKGTDFDAADTYALIDIINYKFAYKKPQYLIETWLESSPWKQDRALR